MREYIFHAQWSPVEAYNNYNREYLYTANSSEDTFINLMIIQCNAFHITRCHSLSDCLFMCHACEI